MVTTLDDIAVPDDSLCVRDLDGEVFLFAGSGDRLHALDDLGSFIWRLLDGRRPLREVLDAILAEYDVAREIAARDLLQFVDSLAEQGVVQLKPGSP